MEKTHAFSAKLLRSGLMKVSFSHDIKGLNSVKTFEGDKVITLKEKVIEETEQEESALTMIGLIKIPETDVKGGLEVIKEAILERAEKEGTDASFNYSLEEEGLCPSTMLGTNTLIKLLTSRIKQIED